MADSFWPLGSGRIVTSPFGPRPGEFHTGVDFGRDGGSAGMRVYAVQSGTVLYCGKADGYGGPDPAGWIVIDSDDSQGGGCWEYGHIVRLPNIKPGVSICAGQQIAVVNPERRTNGGVDPHLHVSFMPGSYDPSSKNDPFPRLRDALEPDAMMKETAMSNKPAFNEYWVSSPSFNSRGGTKVDLFLLHTQEGAGNADSLGRFLANPANNVSYHYTISQAADGGVTVCDVVDTDYASWSCLSANNRSINLCFAGSSVNWSREKWLQQSKAIEVAAYIAVQDCKKYGIPLKVLNPPYKSAPPGISDHKYVTQYLGDGTHTDVGPNFCWDVFAGYVTKWSQTQAPPTPPAAPVVAPPAKPVIKPAVAKPVGPADDQITLRWNCLGGKTVVEALAEIRDKVLGTNDRGKPGAL
ncbi:MAG: peptidoglycan DD-metalloendopeptidase family protein [Fluviibacter sp.]